MSDFPRQAIPAVRCRHISCKGMAVYGAGYQTPVDEMNRSNDFWCSHTQSVLGPDHALVVLSRCVPGRECYEEL